MAFLTVVPAPFKLLQIFVGPIRYEVLSHFERTTKAAVVHSLVRHAGKEVSFIQNLPGEAGKLP
ncbi:hypothetical protein D3C72_2185660 [compost metagenome]